MDGVILLRCSTARIDVNQCGGTVGFRGLLYRISQFALFFFSGILVSTLLTLVVIPALPHAAMGTAHNGEVASTAASG